MQPTTSDLFGAGEQQRIQLLCYLYGRHAPLEVCSLIKQCTPEFTYEAQEEFLQLLSTDPVLLALPLEPQYRVKLYKHLIALAESTGQELCDGLVEAYTHLLQAATGSASDSSAGQALWFTKTVTWGCAQTQQTVFSPTAHALVRQHAERAARCRVQSSTDSSQGTPDSMLVGSGADAQNATPGERISLQDPAAEHNQSPGAAALLQPLNTPPGAHRSLGRPEEQASAQLASAPQPGSAQDAGTTALSVPWSPGVGLVSLRVSGNVLEGGTGCADWEAGWFLAECLLNNPGLVQGRRCLELGCGPGTVGVIAHWVGARHVLLTDGDMSTVQNCVFNCRLNGVPVTQCPGEGSPGPCAVEVQQLSWSADVSGITHPPDVILASDVVYDPEVLPALVSILAALLTMPLGSQEEQADAQDRPAGASLEGPAGRACGVPKERRDAGASQQHTGQESPQRSRRPVAYVATTKRNEKTLAQFMNLLAAAGITVEDVTTELSTLRAPVDDGQGAQRVEFLYVPRLTAARGSVLLHRLQAR